jgi:hypothetical protein
MLGWGRRDLTYLRQARNLRDWQQVAIGRFPCELPPAILTPNASLGRSYLL